MLNYVFYFHTRENMCITVTLIWARTISAQFRIGLAQFRIGLAQILIPNHQSLLIKGF